jgi:acetyl-CoA carboxylase carboxyl transferase subunit alpha
LRLGVIVEVVPEAPGGAHRDFDATARHLGDALRRHLAELAALKPERLRELRYEKFRRMGAFVEAPDASL